MREQITKRLKYNPYKLNKVKNQLIKILNLNKMYKLKTIKI